MSNIENMGKQFKDLVELQAYNDAQTKTIVTQSKQITELQKEITHLKELLAKGVPILKSENRFELEIADEEQIARMELRKLRDRSMNEELTMEDAKKVDIFSKVLHQSLNKPKTLNINAKNMSKDELLAIAESSDDEKI